MFDVIEFEFEYTEEREGLDPLVYVDGEYRGSLDQLFTDELLAEASGKLVKFSQIGTNPPT